MKITPENLQILNSFKANAKLLSLSFCFPGNLLLQILQLLVQLNLSHADKSKSCNKVLANWFARKNVDDTIMFVQYLLSVTKRVRSISD